VVRRDKDQPEDAGKTSDQQPERECENQQGEPRLLGLAQSSQPVLRLVWALSFRHSTQPGNYFVPEMAFSRSARASDY
jgi:hypothetical protein